MLLGVASHDCSVTLAGDIAQRLMMDNGFSDWSGVLRDLGLSGVEVEPLRIGYRSTLEVLAFARDILGHRLHIGATRAAHQLWIASTGIPSPILPRYMIED